MKQMMRLKHKRLNLAYKVENDKKSQIKSGFFTKVLSIKY